MLLSKAQILKKIFSPAFRRGGEGILCAVFLTISFARLSAAVDPNPVDYSVDTPPPVPPVAATPPGVSTNTDKSQMIYIKEFRVICSHQLSRSEIEKAV